MAARRPRCALARAGELEARSKLLADGFLERGEAEALHPAARWHAAMARAALSLHGLGVELEDLRVPVIWALNETYGATSSDDELVEMVAVMAPLTGR